MPFTTLQKVATAFVDPLAKRVAEAVNAIISRLDRTPEYFLTAAEISAGVTPVDYRYPEGHLYRYGLNTTPGTTSMSTAMGNALKVGVPVVLPEGDEVLLDSAVTVTGNIDLRGTRSQIVGGGSNDLFSLTGGGSVRVRGVRFSGFKTAFAYSDSGSAFTASVDIDDECSFRDYSLGVVRCVDDQIDTSSKFTHIKIRNAEFSAEYTDQGFDNLSFDVNIVDAAVERFELEGCYTHDGGKAVIRYEPSAAVRAVDTTGAVFIARGNVHKNYRNNETANDADMQFYRLSHTRRAIINGNVFQGLLLDTTVSTWTDDREAVRLDGPAGAVWEVSNNEFIDAGASEGAVVVKGAGARIDRTLRVTDNDFTITDGYKADLQGLGGFAVAITVTHTDSVVVVEGNTFRNYDGTLFDMGSAANNWNITITNNVAIDCTCDQYSEDALFFIKGNGSTVRCFGNEAHYPNNTAATRWMVFFGTGHDFKGGRNTIGTTNGYRVASNAALDRFESSDDQFSGSGTNAYLINGGDGITEVVIDGAKWLFDGGAATWQPIHADVWTEARTVDISAVITGTITEGTRPFFYGLPPDGAGIIDRYVSVVDTTNDDWATYHRRIAISQEAGGGISVTEIIKGDTDDEYFESTGSGFVVATELSNGLQIITHASFNATRFVMRLNAQIAGQ